VALIGLEDCLCGELTARLAEKYPSMNFVLGSTAEECLQHVSPSGIDLVFCSSQANHFLSVLDCIKSTRPEVPVIVVSRHPEASQWLDAIEAGAADYCAAPFEPAHVGWIVDAHLSGPQTATA
jgi:DNA-binding NtrC family response regulator